MHHLHCAHATSVRPRRLADNAACDPADNAARDISRYIAGSKQSGTHLDHAEAHVTRELGHCDSVHAPSTGHERDVCPPQPPQRRRSTRRMSSKVLHHDSGRRHDMEHVPGCNHMYPAQSQVGRPIGMHPESAQKMPVRRAKCTVSRIMFPAASLGQLRTAHPISLDGNVDERPGTTLQVASDGGPGHGSEELHCH